MTLFLMTLETFLDFTLFCAHLHIVIVITIFMELVKLFYVFLFYMCLCGPQVGSQKLHGTVKRVQFVVQLK